MQPLEHLVWPDEVTLTQGRVSNEALFARALIAVDLSKELVKGANIRDWMTYGFWNFDWKILHKNAHLAKSFCFDQRHAYL